MDAAARRIQALKQELKVLEESKQRQVVKMKPTARAAAPKHHHSTPVVLSGNYSTTTHRGSIYATMLMLMAALSKLATQDTIFAAFRKQPNSTTARRLLDQIGVSSDHLKELVRKDPDFKAHCRFRTRWWRALAANGSAKAKRVLSNRKIFDASGRWRGDLDEAITILRAGANPNRQATYKNSGLLRNAKASSSVGGLLFDRSFRGGVQYLYVYPRKHFNSFQRARVLAGE